MATSREEIVISLKDEFSSAAKNINSAMSAVKVAISAAFGSEALKLIGESVKAFSEAEKQTTELGFALKSIGLTSKSTFEDYKKFSEEIKNTTFFTDEQVISVEKLLTTYGIYGEQLKQTIKVASDFATLHGKGLEETVQMFIRALEGGGAGLSRYGVKISDAKIRTEGLNAILQAADKNIEGFARAAADSEAGGLKKFSDAVNDMQKAVGGFFASIDQKYGVTKFWTDAINKATGAMTVQKTELENLNAELSITKKELEDLYDAEILNEEQDKKNALAISNKKAMIQSLTAQIEELSKATDKNNKLTSNKGMTLDPEKERAQVEYKKYYANLLAQNDNYFEAIQENEEKELVHLKEQLKHALISQEQYDDAKRQLDKKANTDYINGVGTAFSAVTELAKGHVNGFINQIKTLLPAQAQSIISIGQTAFSALTSILDAFAADTRTAFEKTIEDISALNSAIDELYKNVQDLKGEKQRESEGRSVKTPISASDIEGLIDTGRFTIGLAHPNQAQIDQLVSQKFGGLNIQTKNGLIEFLLGQETFGFYDPALGGFNVTHRIYDLPENQLVALMQFIYGRYKDQLNTTPEAHATGGLIGGSSNMDDTKMIRASSGEYVVSRKGVNQRTIGMLNALNSGMEPSTTTQIVHIHAMDAQSFESFMKSTGAKVLRNLTGRQGVVIAGSRGVSANA